MNFNDKGISTHHKYRKGRRKRSRWLRLCLYLILAGFLWTVYVLSQIGSVERSPALVGSTNEPFDVGIVLGAAMWGDVPSPGLEERLLQSLQDYKEGKFRYFILSGGLDSVNNKYTEAEGMANYLETHGVSRDVMLLENKATSTYENLEFSQKIMEEHGLTSALIITHTYHGNRALEMAEVLQYSNPKLSLTESKVLKPVTNITREILAYTKWKLVQLGFAIGMKS